MHFLIFWLHRLHILPSHYTGWFLRIPMMSYFFSPSEVDSTTKKTKITHLSGWNFEGRWWDQLMRSAYLPILIQLIHDGIPLHRWDPQSWIWFVLSLKMPFCLDIFLQKRQIQSWTTCHIYPIYWLLMDNPKSSVSWIDPLFPEWLNPNVCWWNPHTLCLNPHRLPVASSWITVVPPRQTFFSAGFWLFFPNWCFQSPWKIWKSDWIIIPNLVGENKIHLPNHRNQFPILLGSKSPISPISHWFHQPIFRVPGCVPDPTGSASWALPPSARSREFHRRSRRTKDSTLTSLAGPKGATGTSWFWSFHGDSTIGKWWLNQETIGIYWVTGIYSWFDGYPAW